MIKGDGVIITNRKARRDYFIVETVEAGMELKGSEVKSLRDRRGNLNESFAKINGREVFLYNLHISPYTHGSIDLPDPLRTRKLLLHKHEIQKLFGKLSVARHTLIPLKLYFKKGKVKVELALARGKAQYDKRESIKRKMHDREIRRRTGRRR